MRGGVRVGLVLAVIVVTSCDAESTLDASVPDAGVEADASEARVCEPGETIACDCATGPGERTCVERGIGFGACTCVDAAVVELDAGTLNDAGDDASVTPADAGGVDAGGEPADGGPPWGECWLIPQAGCTAGWTCRRVEYDANPSPTSYSPRPGPPVCDRAGLLDEHETDCEEYVASTDSRRDLCGVGLFCAPSSEGCVRYCDPAGDPCPADSEGRSQYCVEYGPFDPYPVPSVWYCSIYAP